MNTESLGNTMSIEAEQAVLGALLTDRDAIDRVGELEPQHFYRHDHRLIYIEIQRQAMAGAVPDPLTVAEKLGDRIEDALQYLIKLRSTEPSGARVTRHAAIVVDKAKKRALLALGMEMQQMAESHRPAVEVADEVAGRLGELSSAKLENDPQRMSASMTQYAQMVEARHDGTIKMLSTGHRDLDRALGGGLEPGLIIVAGRPAMGKTAAGLGIARNASEQGVGLFFSMEMPRNQVNDRNVSALGQMPLSWLKHPDNDTTRWDALTHAIKESERYNLYIDDQTALNMMQIRSKARKVKREAGRLDVIVIDQLNFMTGAKANSGWEAIGEHTRALANLAKEMDIPVILLCQLSRDLEKRADKRPVLSDLAGSPSIEQDGAVIMFCYRDEYYHPDTPDKGIAEIIIAKSRQGKTGKAHLAYIGEQTRFADLAHGWQQQPKIIEQPRSRGLD